jgi:hypothetical protein
MFSDGFIAVWLFVLVYFYYRWGGVPNQDPAWQREPHPR